MEEYTCVCFDAKVKNITSYEDRGCVVIQIFDGTSVDRFTCYNAVELLKNTLIVNNVYKFSGILKGKERRYFMLESFDQITIDYTQEYRFYPENFIGANDNALFIYNTSIAMIKDSSLRLLVSECLGIPCDLTPCSDINEKTMKIVYDRYKNAPASLNHHDNYRGGYIVHIAGILSHINQMEISFRSSSCYRTFKGKTLDFDYLRTLAYLHDCGKPYTYRYVNGTFVWNNDNILTHEQYGAHIVSSSIASRRMNNTLLQKVIKGILEHMNPKESVIKEINILKNIDRLESSIADYLN